MEACFGTDVEVFFATGIGVFFATGVEVFFDKGLEICFDTWVIVDVQADRISIPKTNAKRGSVHLSRKPAMQERFLSLFLYI